MSEPWTANSIVLIIAIGGGLAIAALAILFSMIHAMLSRKEFEQTRREIAAYVAEGSLTPEDAQRLLETNPPKGPKSPCRTQS